MSALETTHEMEKACSPVEFKGLSFSLRDTHLVPYTENFVETYNSFMREDEEMRDMTGSELLTLEEEYEMCRQYATDENKFCFIIVEEKGKNMLGDVNLFCGEEGAELNVMICEKSARRRGHARRAVELVLQKAHHLLGIPRFVAKIKLCNKPSIAMFEKLGFVEESRSDVFEEVSMIKEF